MHYGPKSKISEQIHAEKYRMPDETFVQSAERQARALAQTPAHMDHLVDIYQDQRFLNAGRIQRAVGTPDSVTPFNCFVSGVVEDSMSCIMDRLKQAAFTMRQGGGIGYDFSRIRPSGDDISTLRSPASGPVSFMQPFDAVCGTISSSGHRRGAQMGVLRVDHPDILTFIRAKQNDNNLTRFNISVGVTDEFMNAVAKGLRFELRFEGRVYETVSARDLWEEIMESTWDWAEPGVLFLDQINRKNNLWYCETIEATNPCAEQPLPPYGACLLGSFNLVKYLRMEQDYEDYHYTGREYYEFDWDLFSTDIAAVVPALDHVIDIAKFPLEAQELEARRKRRMGIGVTGLANCAEALGLPYGSPLFLEFQERLLSFLADQCYYNSMLVASYKEPFPLFDQERYLQSEFLDETIDRYIVNEIRKHGIRNSHLTSIAPTGTISLTADNVSSGIEPVFSYGYDRTIQTPDGPITEYVEDYGSKFLGVKGVTAEMLSVERHVDVLTTAQKYVDSSVSKTCNVGDDVTFEQFQDVYMRAWQNGAKGCTTFRASGKRFGILNANPPEVVPEVQDDAVDPSACYFDPETGKKSCE